MQQRTLGRAGLTVSALGLGCMGMSDRGVPTGQIRRFEDLAPDDYPRHTPRFQGENFQKNLGIVAHINDLATQKSCTPGQLVLAWVLAQGPDIVPIPGTKRVQYLEENLGALNVHLSADELTQLAAIAPKGAAAGQRYPEQMMKSVSGQRVSLRAFRASSGDEAILPL